MKDMKILHFTHVYSNTERLNALRDFAKNLNGLEVVAVSGDLLGRCLDSTDVQVMRNVVSFILNNPLPGFIQGGSYDEVMASLAEQDDSQDHKRAAQAYLEIQRKFDEKAEEQYKTLREILEGFPPDKNRVFLVHGGFDSRNFYDYLSDLSLHPIKPNNSVKEVDGITFAGYGGSSIDSLFIPRSRIIFFSQALLYDYLTRKDGDVAVISVNPYNPENADEVSRLQDFASLAYINKKHPDLVLCGCSDTPYVRIEKKTESNGTVIVNSGSLSLNKQGTFSVIDTVVEKDLLKVKSVHVHTIGTNGITESVKYEIVSDKTTPITTPPS